MPCKSCLLYTSKRKSEKRASSFRVGMAEDNLNKVMDQVELEIGVARKALSQAMERVRLSESSLAKAEENEAKADVYKRQVL